MSPLKRLALAAVRNGLMVPKASSIERLAQLSDLRAVLTELEVDCVLDVGANRGQFAEDLRGVGYKGWIVSFEPIPALYAELSRRLDPNWLAFNFALSSRDETIAFNITEQSVFSSFHVPLGQAIASSVPVECRRLEGVLPRLEEMTGARRIFLKMDTQGHDVEVFDGAGPRVRDFVGLQSELSVVPIYDSMPHYLDALRLYEASGFKLRNLYVVDRAHDGGVLEYDCVMTRGRS